MTQMAEAKPRLMISIISALVLAWNTMNAMIIATDIAGSMILCRKRVLFPCLL
jgi:hypothetical protein